jgi:uncharacterized repeat protein (TIGR01451 family)
MRRLFSSRILSASFLAVAGLSASREVSAQPCTANTAFAPAVSYAASGTGGVVVGDFNGDGRPDVAVAADNVVSVLLGKGDGTFQAAVNSNDGGGGNPHSVAIGDFNGDGKQDLAVPNNAGSVSILLGNGNGTFQAPVNYGAGASGSQSVAVGDFNSDGKTDLVVTNFTNTSVSILLGNGDGTFQAPVIYLNPDFTESVAVGDLNGDGKVDLAVATRSFFSPTGAVWILLGNGDGTFQSAATYGTGAGPDFVIIKDFNRDGKADLAVANGSSNNLSILLGNGDGTFQGAVSYPVGQVPVSVASGDFNGDGQQDLVVVNSTSPYVSMLLGNGNGTFQAAVNYQAGILASGLAVADFNADGKPDLAVATPDQQIFTTGIAAILLNSGCSTDLSITKTDGQTTVTAGTSVTYTITASNAGPAAATGATVRDTFPSILTGVTWTCSASSGSSCGATSGSGNISQLVNLLSGGSATFLATGVVASAATGTLSNTADLIVPLGLTDTNPSNNRATRTNTLLPVADLSITKTDGKATAAARGTVIYTIVATNVGSLTANGATVTDTLPTELTAASWTCVGAGGGTCAASGSGSINDNTVNLPAGASVTYTLTGTVSANARGLSNTATVATSVGMTDPNLANNSATDTDTLICAGEMVVLADGRVSAGVIGAGATVWLGSSLKIGDSYSLELKNPTEPAAPPGTTTVFAGDDGCSGTSTLATRDTTLIDPVGEGLAQRVSFTATGTERFFRARVVNSGASVPFTFSLSDTTLFSSAWSTNGSFDTFYSFQNTTGAALNGTLTLLDTAGATLSTFDLSIPAGQTASTNTSTLAVASGRTGTARFTHNGPPGAIVAEAAIANFTISPAYVQPVKFLAVREAK